jgi:hypothetical protein
VARAFVPSMALLLLKGCSHSSQVRRGLTRGFVMPWLRGVAIVRTPRSVLASIFVE